MKGEEFLVEATTNLDYYWSDPLLLWLRMKEFAMDFESLATKFPIVDWKTHVLAENFMYYQIFRADGSSKNYKIFSEMLDDFDRQDILFEPDEEDEVWKNQHEYNLIS
ncbi:hypothetical protein Tco_0620889 [Tanacetum coccineum]